MRGKDSPQRLPSEDDALTEAVKLMGHRAQFHQATIEAQRRDKVRDGLGQMAEEGGKALADAAGIAAIGVPVGTIYGAGRTAQSAGSAAKRAYRK